MQTSSHTRTIARQRAGVKAKLYGLGIPSLLPIARTARIAKSTLSNYLSFRRANPDTRRRILDAANALRSADYDPLTYSELWRDPVTGAFR